jgi:hypothetical protein
VRPGQSLRSPSKGAAELSRLDLYPHKNRAGKRKDRILHGENRRIVDVGTLRVVSYNRPPRLCLFVLPGLAAVREMRRL